MKSFAQALIDCKVAIGVSLFEMDTIYFALCREFFQVSDSKQDKTLLSDTIAYVQSTYEYFSDLADGLEMTEHDTWAQSWANFSDRLVCDLNIPLLYVIVIYRAMENVRRELESLSIPTKFHVSLLDLLWRKISESNIEIILIGSSYGRSEPSGNDEG